MSSVMLSGNSLQAEDLYLLEQPLEMNVSRDGRFAVVTVEATARKENKKFSNLWLISLEDGTKRQLTRGTFMDRNPCFSPKGDKVAFLSNREGSTQIHMIWLNGGESWALTDFHGEVQSLSWSKKGDELLISLQEEDANQKLIREAKENNQPEKAAPTHYLIDRMFYKGERGEILSLNHFQVWRIDAQSGEGQALTNENFSCINPSYSADGQTIFFCGNGTPRDHNWDFGRNDIWKVSATGGKSEKLFDWEGEANLARPSSDGKYVAFVGNKSVLYGLTENSDVFLFSLEDSDAKPVNITESIDRTFFNFSINDTWGLPKNGLNLQWGPDNKSLYSVCVDMGNSRLVEIDIQTQKIIKLDSPNGVVLDFGFSDDFEKGAVLFSDFASPGKVLPLNLKNNLKNDLKNGAKENFPGRYNVSAKAKTHFNSWLDKRQMFPTATLFSTVGESKQKIHGWVLKPYQYQPEKKYPGVLYIHGGPIAQYSNSIFHEFQFLASQGYFVLYCNPHGSHGYGRDFCVKLNRNWGIPDFDDQMSFVDEALARYPSLDSERLGVAGGSYGGFMAARMTSKTNRFKAAIAERGVYNLLSLVGTSDFNIMFRIYFQKKFPLIEEPDLLWDLSPLKYAAQVKTPTLIIHSESDHRTPLEQAEQYYMALKSTNVETIFARFPHSDHNLSRNGRTDRRIARLHLIQEWLDKWLA